MSAANSSGGSVRSAGETARLLAQDETPAANVAGSDADPSNVAKPRPPSPEPTISTPDPWTWEESVVVPQDKCGVSKEAFAEKDDAVLDDELKVTGSDKSGGMSPVDNGLEGPTPKRLLVAENAVARESPSGGPMDTFQPEWGSLSSGAATPEMWPSSYSPPRPHPKQSDFSQAEKGWTSMPASSSRGSAPDLGTGKFNPDKEFNIHWLAVSLRDLETVRDRHARSFEVLEMLLGWRCKEFLQSLPHHSATRRDFLSTLRNGLPFMRREHSLQVQDRLKSLGVDLTSESDQKSFAGNTFVEHLINEARGKAGIRDPCRELSEAEHDDAYAFVRTTFEASHVTSQDLVQSIRLLDCDDGTLGRKEKAKIRQQRRNALNVWIKSLTGDKQLFHSQLRYGTMGVEDRGAVAKALILTRIEVHSSPAQCKLKHLRESLRRDAVAARQDLKRARKHYERHSATSDAAASRQREKYWSGVLENRVREKDSI